MPKDGRPKVTPDLTERESWAGTEATPGHPMNILDPPKVEAPKVWVMNYQIRLNGTQVTRQLMVPRGTRRDTARDEVGRAMAMDLANLLETIFGD